MGTYDTWTPSAGTDYECVDDPDYMDGDTSTIKTTAENQMETFNFSASNPVPVGATIRAVQLRGTGKRDVVAGKQGARFMCRLGGVDLIDSIANSATVTSDYAGGRWWNVPRPGGGSWVQGDADPGDLQFGVVSENDPDQESAPFATKLPGPEWVYYEDTLPLGTTPAVASQIKKVSGVAQASIKKISGVAIASVKKVAGVSNV